jgi:hypothetical protein
VSFSCVSKKAVEWRRRGAVTPPGHRVFIRVTLTDEYPLIQAQVIIEAVETAGAGEVTPRLESF